MAPAPKFPDADCISLFKWSSCALQMMWPWRVCMAVVRWIYSSLDERRMSQRRHVAEVALRSAMKSGGPSQLHGCFCLGS